MDAARLDALARSLTTPHSRRVLARLLSGLAVSSPLTLLGMRDAASKKKGKGKKKHKKHKKRAVCASDTKSCPTKCTSDADCVAYRCDVEFEICDTECGSQYDCQRGYRCDLEERKEQCVLCRPGDECPCTSDADCVAYPCLLDRGTCDTFCETRDGCQRGYWCDLAQEKCVRLGTCADFDDCPPPAWCDVPAGVCRPGCRSHNDCPDCYLCDMADTHECYLYDPVCCADTPGCSSG
jgi:hypothetical protein